MLDDAVENNQIKVIDSLSKINPENYSNSTDFDSTYRWLHHHVTLNRLGDLWASNNIETAEALANYAIKRGVKYKDFVSAVLTSVNKPSVATKGTALFDHYVATGIKFARQESIEPGEHLASVLINSRDLLIGGKELMDIVRVVDLATEYGADHTKICIVLIEGHHYKEAKKFIETALERGVRMKSEMSTALEDALQYEVEAGHISFVDSLFKLVQTTGIDIDKKIAQEVLEQAMHAKLQGKFSELEDLIRALGVLREHYDRYFGAGAYDRKFFSWSSRGYSQPTVDTDVSNAAYEVLGLDRDASFEEAYSTYRELVKKHHPDKNPGDKDAAKKRTQEINNAWETLRKQLEPKS